MGITPLLPPRAEVSRIDELHRLWVDAGLTDVASREIVVTRTFDDFADFWASVEIAIGMGRGTRDMSAGMRADLKNRLRARLSVDADDRISLTSRANAVAGRVIL